MKKFIFCKLLTQSSELMTRYKLEYSGPLRPVLSADVLQQAALLVQQQHLYNNLQYKLFYCRQLCYLTKVTANSVAAAALPDPPHSPCLTLALALALVLHLALAPHLALALHLALAPRVFGVHVVHQLVPAASLFTTLVTTQP